MPGIAIGQTGSASFWDPYIANTRMAIQMPDHRELPVRKVYSIWTDYQVLSLEQRLDASYEGSLTNFVTRISSGKQRDTLYQRIRIPDTLVAKLMQELEYENIEVLRDCAEVTHYVQGLDGKTYVFEINNASGRRVYAYWEPESGYQRADIPEVKHVRNILTAINTEFSLQDSFLKFRDRLPRGNYSYGMIFMSKW